MNSIDKIESESFITQMNINTFRRYQHVQEYNNIQD